MMPLTWHLAILVAGTVGSAAVGAPKWLIVVLAGLTGGTVLLSWTTYLRLLRSDRDALRSHESQIPRIVNERAALATDREERDGLLGPHQGSGDRPSLPPSSVTERGA